MASASSVCTVARLCVKKYSKSFAQLKYLLYIALSIQTDMTDKIIYDWGLYDVVRDDHFVFQATPQQIAEAMPDPDISVRLIRYDRNGDWEDCHIAPDGTFEHDGFFLGGYSDKKVPKRYVEQAARWVKKYGYACHEVWAIDE